MRTGRVRAIVEGRSTLRVASTHESTLSRRQPQGLVDGQITHLRLDALRSTRTSMVLHWT